MVKGKMQFRESTVILSIVILLACSKLPQNEAQSQDADGTLEQGTRVVLLLSEKVKDTIRVYRGDAVEMRFSKSLCPSCTIPSGKTVTSDIDTLRIVKFTASDTGVFPVMKTPQNQFTALKVTEFVPKGKAAVKNLSGKEAAEALKDTSIFILDVRTPAEYNEGHISRATLISVAELADRIKELEPYKHKPIFVYCRSGNRSIVAVQILTKQGFTNILHLKGGIKSWTVAGLPLDK